MPSNVQLIREDEQQILLAHRPMSGWAVFLIGMAVFYPAASGMITAGLLRWWVGGFGLLFALAGLAGAIWRYELALDLGSRRYTRRRGFWPGVTEQAGSLDEIEAVRLGIEIQSGGKSNSRTPLWVVRLEFRGDPKSVSVAEFRDESKGYQRAEHLAKALRVPLVDSTGDEEKRIAWDALDRPLSEQVREGRRSAFASSGISAPPADSRIMYSGEAPRREILLPAPGLNVVTLFLCVWGTMFGAGGAVFLWRKLAGMPVKENPPGITWVLAPVFVCIGLIAILAGLAGCLGRELVRESETELAIGVRVFGRTMRMRALGKREIEEIGLKPAPLARRVPLFRSGTPAAQTPGATRHELFIRSDKGALRCGGALSPAEQEWLKQALTAMVTS